MQINQILQIFKSAIHISEPLLERMSLFSASTASTVPGVASCQYQNIHKLRHNGHNSALLLKCVYVCVHVCACVCARVCGGGLRGALGEGAGGALHHQFKPIFDIFYGLEVSVDMAVLFGLCLWITACLLRSPAPTLKRCGTKMFYLLSGLASIKLMESIQLPSFPFPFRPQPQMRIH